MPDSGNIYALVIGIDQWINPTLPKLFGCVNDATLMRDTLLNQFGVPAENLVFLTNSEATRERITKTFQEHLIDRARTLRLARQESEPAFVFYYAGHGSRNRDLTGTQPDGMDETIVPHDSRTEGVFDIRDWELGSWISSLTQWSSNVTIIMDCCHAGSGTRDDEDVAAYRTCPPDLRAPVGQRPVSTPGTGTRSTGGDENLQPQYTLLAACQSFESAREITSDGIPHGAFSWYLVRELNQLTSQREITCRDLMDRVRFQVHSRYPSQLPQCEGARDRLLFGGARPARQPCFQVQSITGDDLWVDAGAAHGISVGAQFQLIAESDPGAQPPQPTLSVVEVQAVQSRCRMDQGTPVPQFSKLRVRQRGQTSIIRTVSVDDGIVVRPALVSALQSPDLRGTLKLNDQLGNSEFRITSVGSTDNPAVRIGLRDQSGRLLSEPVEPDNWDRLLLDLQGLCRYRNLLDLRNPDRESQLAGLIQVELHQIIGEGTPADPATRKRGVREVAPIGRTADGLPIVEVGKPITISVTNRSDQPLYCEVVSLGYDYAIVPLSSLLSAAGGLKRIDPGMTEWFGRDRSERKIVFNLPPNRQAREQFVEAREFLKVFATQAPSDYEILRQDGLRLPVASHRTGDGSPLSQMLSQVMNGSSRALGVELTTEEKSDWTTVEQEYIVLPAGTPPGQTITDNSTVTLATYPITVTTPPGCDIQVAVRSELGMRQLDSGTEAAPGSSFSNRINALDHLSRVTLVSDLPAVPAGTALDISISAESMGKVSPQSPIRIQLPGQSAPPDLAIAWNGEFAVPVGWSDQNSSLAIAHLPDDVALSQASSVESGSRGLARMVRLYLFRLRNTTAPDLGLSELRFVPQDKLASTPILPGERCVPIASGELRYSPVNAKTMTAGSRVLLLVHGFGSSGSAMFEQLNAVIQDCQGKYANVLVFDYESYRTGIAENAVILWNQLKASGFSATDKVTLDVIGEGMGALVTRAMVELQGGREFVDRCCFLGSLNEGTPLMQIKDYLPWLGALAINALAPVAANAFLTGLLKTAEQQAAALADLRPGSSFLTQLNQQGNRGASAYHLIAGRFVPAANAAGMWQRFWNCVGKAADGALDLFFADQHDLVSSVSSLTKVSTGGSLGLATTAVVPSHHFEYLRCPEVATQLLTWIKS